jgi:hypothetical protein
VWSRWNSKVTLALGCWNLFAFLHHFKIFLKTFFSCVPVC